MKNDILKNLRSVLVKLYYTPASMRRIIDDTGLDFSRIALESNPGDSWHSILIEAEKLGQVDDLLSVVNDEYSRNAEFRDAYKAYRQSVSQTIHRNTPAPLHVRLQSSAQVHAVGYAIYVNLHLSKVMIHLGDCGHIQQNNTPPDEKHWWEKCATLDEAITTANRLQHQHDIKKNSSCGHCVRRGLNINPVRQ